jgi:salicylate hydroxylase
VPGDNRGMTMELVIAGGGIGGLAAAVAARRAGWEARLVEQAAEFSEVGAGLQLGPNATRRLAAWGLLTPAFVAQCAFPQRLRVRDAHDGAELAAMALGPEIEQRYGAPYLTLHRADLQQLLLQAAQQAGTRLHTGSRVVSVAEHADAVNAVLDDGRRIEADAAVAADGVWSALRTQLLADGAAPATGHLAYRTLVPMGDVPAASRTPEVCAWLGPRMHLVNYPVRGGDWMNVVCVVQGELPADPHGWDHAAAVADLQRAAGPLAAPLRALIEAAPQWRLWALHDRAPVSGAQQMAQGRIALLGDAAHPMRPYLAQGAAMAIEDAGELQRVLAVADGRTIDVPTALKRYALGRWQRCARVQARSQRNGRIFHATGALRLARNTALRLLGAKLLDVPWLYRA